MMAILYCYSNMDWHYIHEYFTSSDGEEYICTPMFE